MDNPTDFYQKKLKLYEDARDNLERAMTALVLIQSLEELHASCPDADEIVEIENILNDISNAKAFATVMVHAVNALI